MFNVVTAALMSCIYVGVCEPLIVMHVSLTAVWSFVPSCGHSPYVKRVIFSHMLIVILQPHNYILLCFLVLSCWWWWHTGIGEPTQKGL